jgi:hypothetical protein
MNNTTNDSGILAATKIVLYESKEIAKQACFPIFFAIDIIKKANKKIESLPFIPRTIVKLSIGALTVGLAVPIVDHIAGNAVVGFLINLAF